jgi:hypothetical protein
MRRISHAAVALTAALCLAGCDNELEDLPTIPDPVTVTDEFTGTINVNGAATHTFVVVQSGATTATLTEVLPDPAIGVGFTMGTWNGTVCQTVLSNDNAIQGNALVGTSTGAGTLCVRIHDNGKLTEPLTYKLTVVHP